jgi:glucose/arabinose dehydrogenase
MRIDLRGRVDSKVAFDVGVLENDRVVGEEHLLADKGQRIRDVRLGPDGALTW